MFKRNTSSLRGCSRGSYELEIRKGGYDIFRKEIEVKPGEPTRVRALLTAEEGLGSVKVSSDPGGAKIYIDESYQGSTPPRQDVLSCRISWLVENLEPGKHILRVAKDGYRDYEEEVKVRSGRVESINCELIPLISRDISMSKEDTLPNLERQKELEAFLEGKILDIVEEEDLDETTDVKKNKRRSSIRFAILASLSLLILFLFLLGIYYNRGSRVKEEVEMIAICSLPLEARAFMDGEYLGKTPLTLKPPPLGEHQLRLFLPGYESWKGELKTEGDAEIYVVLKEDKKPPEVLGVGSTIPSPGQPLVLKAIIKDNSFVEKASLFYRRLGEKDWRGSRDFELISSEDNEYQAIVPSSELGDGIQYYLEVSDGVNLTRFPREDLIAVKLESPLVIASTDRIGGEEQVAFSQSKKIVSSPVERKPPSKREFSLMPIAAAQEAKEVPPPPPESLEVRDERRFSSLKIDSKPAGSKIYLNDEFLGYAPLLRYHLSSGRYRVRVAKDGFHNWQAMIKIREGEDMNLDVELKAY